MRRSHPLAVALFLAGCLQMGGELVGSPALRGLGAAAAFAPAPKVFSSAKGLETFTSTFIVEGFDDDGAPRAVTVDPARNAGLRGPYARRNAYGAALAYGPVLAEDERTRPLVEAVLRHALCGDAPLLRELGLADLRGPVAVRVVPREGTDASHLPLVFAEECR